MMGGGRNGSKYTSRNVVGQEEEEEDDTDGIIKTFFALPRSVYSCVFIVKVKSYTLEIPYVLLYECRYLGLGTRNV